MTAIRIYHIRTLLAKPNGTKPSEGKRVQYSCDVVDSSLFVRTASLKTLSIKPSGTKLGQREKKYNTLTSCHKYTPPHVNVLQLTHSNLVY